MTYFLSGEWGDREGNLPSNEAKNRTLRANLNIAPSDNVDVAISTGFGSTELSLPNNDNTTLCFLGVALNGFPWQLPLLRTDPVTGEPGVETCPIDYEGSIAFGLPLGTVSCAGDAFFSGRTFEDVATISNTQKIERFTGSVAVDYRPKESLRARGTIGYDQFSDQTGTFIPVDPTLVFESLSLGFRRVQHFVSRDLTIEGTLAGSLRLSPSLIATTTVGGQFFGEKLESAASIGRTLPSGTSTVSNAVSTEGFEGVTETRTLGIFVEQQLAYRDRLFLTPAVRLDENSAFGVNLGRQAYPRIMASYVLSEESWFPGGWVESLRVRAAWGESGKQPTSFAAPPHPGCGASGLPESGCRGGRGPTSGQPRPEAPSEARSSRSVSMRTCSIVTWQWTSLGTTRSREMPSLPDGLRLRPDSRGRGSRTSARSEAWESSWESRR